MKPEFKKPFEDFWLEGDEDYISLQEIADQVSDALHIKRSISLTVSDNDKRWEGMQEFIILMLQNGFEAVDLELEGKCTAWPDQTSVAVITEIKKQWAEQKGDIGHNVWFNKISK